MSLEFSKLLETLAQKDPDARRSAVASILKKEGISYTTQELEPSYKHPRGICNYVFSTGENVPKLLFCAHYDSVPGSYGVNDNAAGVCILIELAKFLKSKNMNAHFVLFDGEEQQNAGSKHFVSTMNRTEITGVINLDVCGYGNHIVIYGKGHEKKKVFSNFCNKAFMKEHNATIVNYLPPSDDISFSGSNIPTLSIAIVPYWDIQYLKTLGTYGGGILGRPPEFNMILSEMDVMSTLHGGYKDSIEWIEPEAMKRVYDYLSVALSCPLINSNSQSSSFLKKSFKFNHKM